jgi:hypothetical protein
MHSGDCDPSISVLASSLECLCRARRSINVLSRLRLLPSSRPHSQPSAARHLQPTAIQTIVKLRSSMVKHLPAAVLIAVLAVAVSTASSTRVPLCGVCNTDNPCAGLLTCDGTCKKMGVGQGGPCDNTCIFCKSPFICPGGTCIKPTALCGMPCSTGIQCELGTYCIDGKCAVRWNDPCDKCGICKGGSECDLISHTCTIRQ